MSSEGFASPEELAILCRAFDQYCDTHGITDALQREDVAYIVMGLFRRGFTGADEITARLGEENQRKQA